MADSPSPPTSSFQTGFLAKDMGLVGILLFSLMFLGLAFGSIQILHGVWPGRTGSLYLYWFTLVAQYEGSVDSRLIIVATLSGALGSFVHSATSFATFLGNRKLKRSWAMWYVLRPAIGGSLGLVFYFLVRAGFMTPGADGNSINPYGIAAIAALAGMFSKEAADKLRQVFHDVFKPPTADDEARADKL